MANSILTAKVARVPFGLIEIEGLLLEDGNFGIALQQAASLFSVIPTSAPKWLKTRLGEGFQLFQVKTDRPKQLGKQNRAENALTLIQFEKLLMKLDREGVKQAQELRDSLVGLSLTQLFSDAFCIKFDQDDRQNWLNNRQAGIVTRKSLTSVIKTWYENNPGVTSRPAHNMYSETTNRIYQALWNLDAKGLETLLDCDRHDARKHMDANSLKLLERAEANVMDYIEEDNIKPVDAVNLANIRAAKTLPTKLGE
jgi:hypothetical protein